MDIKVRKNFKRRHLAKKFAELGFTKGVEIGTCHGTFASVLCEQNPKLKLITIDPYVAVYQDRRTQRIGNSEQAELYKEAKKLLKPYNCQIVKKHSLDAVVNFDHESIDFVYIDGSHEFDYVMTDIIEWSKRVRKGGIISGHDYLDKKEVEVKRAVDNYAQVHGVKKIYLTDEKSPSWWFTRTW
ncbi:class I SAM-dependent methyltransferase [Candidatus Woesebacteria bacterium]|nr:class I SAM-dependent methyltransferase [Candidatus Woesebacteria bacterium]